MECVLADEAIDMGGEFGEYDATEWAVLVSLYGLSDPEPEPLGEEADAEAELVPSPS